MKSSYQTVLVLIALFIGISSCKKEETSPQDFPSLSEIELHSGENIVVNITGHVLNEDGTAVNGAYVTVANTVVQTDESGMYLFEDISVDSKRAYIHVSASAYFNSGATIDPKVGITNSAEIRLMHKSVSGTLNSSSGGNVTSDGISIDFPANSISFADGQAYTGEVEVSMRALAQDMRMASQLMPGDLAALNASQEVGALTSYGMITVMLETPSGDALQLSEGVQANVSFPIMIEGLSSAPSTIALWHFDELEGIWIEDGTATRVGDHYEGSVSHFSWWNCDLFDSAAYLTVCVTTDQGSSPAPEVYATLDLAGGMSGYGYTQVDGCFGTFIPAGEEMILTIYSGLEPVSITTIGPYAVASTPTITINIDNLVSLETTYTGSLVDCNNVPVVSSLGFYSLPISGNYNGISIDSDANGNFELVISGYVLFDFFYFSWNGEGYVIDIRNMYVLGEENDLGQLSACEAEQIYFNITESGENVPHTMDWLSNYGQWTFHGSESSLNIEDTGGLGPAGVLNSNIYDWVNNLQYDVYPADYSCNITEYPSAPGEYLEGTIVGQSEIPDNPGVWVPISMEFRMQYRE